MMYVDVIVPVPLEGTFTYSVPDEMVNAVALGVRVLVPFGPSKTYTALCVGPAHSELKNITEDKVKSILTVLDPSPVVYSGQLRLWQWMSDYYMSALGDVFTAALPAGLKREENYKPKTETCIGLGEKYRSYREIRNITEILRNKSKQSKVFQDFLALSRWDLLSETNETPDTIEVTREELINVSHSSTSIVKQLCNHGFLYAYQREVGRLNHGGGYHPELIQPLSDVQQTAFEQINTEFEHKNVVLLHGVTSSGKTEIYIHLIEQALRENKQVLYLLPEIALTIQMTSRLQRVFGDRLGIYHSKYSDAERVEIWHRQLSDRPYDVILGARSSVFLPFQRLGLVIVDEEHEGSFKQQDPAPRYHARSAAIVMAQMTGAKTLLGTATPSMESYYNAMTGKYGLVRLMTRYQGIALPEIQVVDVKDLHRRKMMNGPFSPALLMAIRAALEEDKQVILFQNRRGFAPMLECHSCGWVPKCKNCDVSLTLHKQFDVLTCHYCGYTMPVPHQCPNCQSTDINDRGYGTEKIEELLMSLFPEARVARMDLDTTRTRNAYERLIHDFATGKTNVLIGTQMISKGLDFERVAVVGILNADSMLNYPDFRAYEHAFMMMSQVSGRAGRKGKRGLVLLQTKATDLPVIHQVVHNDYEHFYADLLQEREMFHYPPFYHLIYVYLKYKNEPLVEAAAQELGALLRRHLGDRVLGPDKPAVARVKEQHIRKMVLKFENGINLREVRSLLRQQENAIISQARYSRIHIYNDVDPD